jgi:predicted ester cyclase
MPENNEAIVRQIFAAMDQNQNMDGLDQFATANYVGHLPGSPPLGRDGVKQFGNSFFQAIPGLKHDILDVFAAGDSVAVRIRIHGKHTRDLVGPAGAIPPSGRDVDFESLNIIQLSGSKVTEQWISFDMMTVLQQVGAMPAQ